MTRLLDLGDLYVSDFLASDEKPRSEPWPLALEMDDDTRVVSLTSQPPPDLMWGRYWYRSGTNDTMRVALADVVGSILDVHSAGRWLDVACNDGTLLAYVPGDLYRVGVDPAEDSIIEQARQHADLIVQAPFSAEAVGNIEFDVVTCIAMFYDLMDPAQFLADVRHCLASDGLFVLQMSYTPLMLEQLAFDNICHEHARYYTLATLKGELRRAGFQVVDVRLNDVNGGSFRVYAMRDDADVTSFGSAPFRDVAEFRVQSLLEYEAYSGYNTERPWREFDHRLRRLRTDVRTLIESEVAAGRTVYGYGASTKGNTLLQYFGLDASLITAIAERQPQKFGLRTVGTDIPIVSEAEARAANPDYMLVLPWHFVTEFRRRESAYLEGGGRFIVPCPTLEVVSA
jgi:NDP-4-keto-2,6-dideoxyhexose 3-C-methyltransferase